MVSYAEEISKCCCFSLSSFLSRPSAQNARGSASAQCPAQQPKPAAFRRGILKNDHADGKQEQEEYASDSQTDDQGAGSTPLYRPQSARKSTYDAAEYSELIHDAFFA